VKHSLSPIKEADSINVHSVLVSNKHWIAMENKEYAVNSDNQENFKDLCDRFNTPWTGKNPKI
jgi:hypothetical protein